MTANERRIMEGVKSRNLYDFEQHDDQKREEKVVKE